MKLWGITLAAGQGSRFGSDKMACPIPDAMAIERPLVMHALAALQPVCDECVVVLRPEQTALVQAVTQAGSQAIICDTAGEGMAHSLRAGVAAVPQDAAMLLMLGDMPFVQAATMQKVSSALRKGASLVAPFFNGQRGHPVGFSAQWRDAMLTLEGDAGAKRLIQQHPDALTRIECNDPGILRDIDLRSDLPAS